MVVGSRVTLTQSQFHKLRMDWSPDSARNAYLDTLKLCGKHREKRNSNLCKTSEPESKEFLSALAAGMNAQLIVEVAPEASPSTIALAAAARQTGGKLVCIVPEPMLDESQKVIDNSGLNNMVEFKTGDPVDLLANYKNIDFSLINCKSGDYKNTLEMLDVNPANSVVVADNLVEGGRGGDVKGDGSVRRVRSMKLSKGKGMEVTMIGKSEEIKRNHRNGHSRSRSWGDGKSSRKSRWVTKIDAVSGEQHIFRTTQ